MSLSSRLALVKLDKRFRKSALLLSLLVHLSLLALPYSLPRPVVLPQEQEILLTVPQEEKPRQEYVPRKNPPLPTSPLWQRRHKEEMEERIDAKQTDHYELVPKQESPSLLVREASAPPSRLVAEPPDQHPVLLATGLTQADPKPKIPTPEIEPGLRLSERDSAQAAWKNEAGREIDRHVEPIKAQDKGGVPVSSEKLAAHREPPAPVLKPAAFSSQGAEALLLRPAQSQDSDSRPHKLSVTKEQEPQLSRSRREEATALLPAKEEPVLKKGPPETEPVKKISEKREMAILSPSAPETALLLSASDPLRPGGNSQGKVNPETARLLSASGPVYGPSVKKEDQSVPVPTRVQKDAPLFRDFGATDGPRFVHKQQPLYPPLARRLNKEGRVVLKLTIDHQGKLAHVEILESAGFGMTEAAWEAVRKSTFAPAVQDGSPIDCVALLVVRFELKNR